MLKVRFFSAAFVVFMLMGVDAVAQGGVDENPFRQMYDVLPTPNRYRSANGAPGPYYFQQKADYEMDIVLDDANQRLSGSEKITYTNQSPDVLDYLWLQLDQNVRAPGSMSERASQQSMSERMSVWSLRRMHSDYIGGFDVTEVVDVRNRPLHYIINETMMRVDLPSPLKPGESFTLKVDWSYNINNRSEVGGRSGLEYFPEEDNYIYTLAQFFPRMCVYDDVEGWQNKQFLGSGEFALPFGDYKVNLSVPGDHVVAATGVLQNSAQVLTASQRRRLEKAAFSDVPVMIITPEEALENEKSRVKSMKTWTFEAENVRDFAFASSRKFIWDAMGVKFGSRNVMAMSYYPKEGNPLWERYSTHAVAHTLRVYSKYTFDYPYPVAISVHTDQIGMEYPMICFNGGRPEADGTYSERTKYGMISVIIHEVGHNYFPMIINSDERQWTWMDEGLNTFLQYLTEKEWDRDYPSRRGPAYKIVDYMKGDKAGIVPIMVNSESIKQFGNNAYGKPATALNILRETILGPELFDYAFKKYAQRWMFKHPTPSDLFRTLEDASGTDLDWFFRAWFFSTDHVDIALNSVKWYQMSTGNPDLEADWQRFRDAMDPEFVGDIRNLERIEQSLLEKYPELHDYYTTRDLYEVIELDRRAYQGFLSSLNEKEKSWIESGANYYEFEFERVGAIPMPILLKLEFEDGTSEEHQIPAEIWRMDDRVVHKVYLSDKVLVGAQVDPHLETADIDRRNNYWPPRMLPTRFELFKGYDRSQENPMQRAKRNQELLDKQNDDE